MTYVAREVGTYELPAVELARWDVEAGELRRDCVPALTVEVVPGEARVEFALDEDEEDIAEASQDAEPEQFSFTALLRRWALPVGAVLAVALVLRRVASATGFSVDHLRAWWQAREHSEGAYFLRFRRAARSGDAQGTERCAR